jgi:hypothetical protein
MVRMMAGRWDDDEVVAAVAPTMRLRHADTAALYYPAKKCAPKARSAKDSRLEK